MFEAIFRITAQVNSDGQGQRVFRVTEREAPANDVELLSRLATMYHQEVYSVLRAGDDLTVSVRLDLPPREVERTVHMREDRLFEGEDMPEATVDPLPFMQEFYGPLLQARTWGYRIGTLQATPMGLHLYRRLGFREYCTFQAYFIYWNSCHLQFHLRATESTPHTSICAMDSRIHVGR